MTSTTSRKSSARQPPSVAGTFRCQAHTAARSPFPPHACDMYVKFVLALRDDEKGKRMWNMYLEREDSKVVGEYISGHVAALLP